jgi:hypothetical protein
MVGMAFASGAATAVRAASSGAMGVVGRWLNIAGFRAGRAVTAVAAPLAKGAVPTLLRLRLVPDERGSPLLHPTPVNLIGIALRLRIGEPSVDF